MANDTAVSTSSSSDNISDSNNSEASITEFILEYVDESVRKPRDMTISLAVLFIKKENQLLSTVETLILRWIEEDFTRWSEIEAAKGACCNV